MKNFIDSEYAKRVTVSVGRFDPSDTVIFWYAMTPNYKISKLQSTLVFSGKDYPDGVPEDVVEKAVKNHVFPATRGVYHWSRPFLYSGRIITGARAAA